jgi:hypothetical protein
MLDVVLGRDSPPSGLALEPEDSEAKIHLVSLALHLSAIMLSAEPLRSPISLLMTDLETCAKMFIPSSASSEMDQTLNALLPEAKLSNSSHPGFTRYACLGCQYIYVVVDCGEANQVGTCPTCKTEISPRVNSRRLDPTPVFAVDDGDTVGYLVQDPESMRMASVTVRQLPAPTFRALHMLMHMSLWAGELLGFTGGVKQLVGRDVCAGYTRRHIEQDREEMLSTLHVTLEDWSTMMHAAIEMLPAFTREFSATSLTTAVARLEWETGFSRDVYARAFSDPAQFVADRKRQLLQIEQNPCTLEKEIDETVVDFDPAYRKYKLPTLFRTVPVRTVEGLCVDATPEAMENFPVLNLFLKRFPDLKHVHFLVPFVTFTNLVTDRKNLILSRTDNTTIQSFIESQQDPDSVRDHFRNFQVAWNTVRPTVKRFECKDLDPELGATINLSSPLRWCCIDLRDDSIMILAMITELCRCQNEFLEEFLILAASPDEGVSAARRLNRELRVAGLPSVPVQSAPSKAIIGVGDGSISQLLSTLLRYAHHDLRYGYGKRVKHNWTRMEIEVIQLVLFDKAILNGDTSKLKLFVFSGELFSTGSTYVVDEIRKTLPQKPLPADILREIVKSDEVRRDQRKLLDSISTVMYVTSKARMVVGGDTPFSDFPTEVDSTAFRTAMHNIKGIHPLNSDKVRVHHLVSVFEAVEDVGFDAIYDSLRTKKKNSLPVFQVCSSFPAV